MGKRGKLGKMGENSSVPLSVLCGSVFREGYFYRCRDGITIAFSNMLITLNTIAPISAARNPCT